MNTSQAIFKWMEQNKDFFKPQGVCKKIGIDKGNFSRYKKEGFIPEKYLQPIVELIMPLGFTLDEIIEEKNKPEKKFKIEAERSQSAPSINSELDLRINKINELLKLPVKYLPKWERIKLEKELYQLENKNI